MNNSKAKLQAVVMSRRKFLHLATAMGATGIVSLFGGCAGSQIKGELRKLTKNFNIYTKPNPNLRGSHGTWGTWYHMLKRAGYYHTGESYILPSGEPIVACASGLVIESHRKIGSGKEHYKRSGDWVKILHEDGIGKSVITVYYHMRENSRTVKPNQWVNRGQVIGFEGAPHSMHFKHYLSFYGHRQQPNYFGENMGYMDYWDGNSNLDIDPKEVYRRRVAQYPLILKFLSRYKGPNSFELYHGQFMHRGAWSEEDQGWSPTETFKLSEFMYKEYPELFEGSKEANDTLIGEIYANQPIVLTLPMKKG